MPRTYRTYFARVLLSALLASCARRAHVRTLSVPVQASASAVEVAPPAIATTEDEPLVPQSESTEAPLPTRYPMGVFVHFATAHADVLPESRFLLDHLATTLQEEVPDIRFELRVHRAPISCTTFYQNELTELRANRMVEELVRRGVARERLDAIGCASSCWRPDHADTRRASVLVVAVRGHRTVDANDLCGCGPARCA